MPDIVKPATDELSNYEICTRCGREQRLAWSVDHSLWKLAGLKAEGDLLCLECFLQHCERLGVLFKFCEFCFLSLPCTICPDGDVLARIDAEKARADRLRQFILHGHIYDPDASCHVCAEIKEVLDA